MQQQPQDTAQQNFAPPQQDPPETDYGKDNVNLPKTLQGKLIELARMFCEEDKFSRRIEIQESRRSHFFWRSMQHLYWDYKAEGWAVQGPLGAGINDRLTYNEDSSVLFVTNIYQAFGLSLIAVLTQNTPAVRFEPQDAQDPADVATAAAGDRFKKIVEHENDAIMLMTDAAFFSYTDGRVHAWTRWAEDSRTGESRETITLSGILETKVPITANCQSDFLYIQHSTEHHVLMMKEANPDFADQIKGGAQGTGMDVYERTARISVKQGTAVLSQSGDTLTNLSTEQNTWMRRAAFQKFDKDDESKQELIKLFPDGCRVRLVSGIYTGSWNENLDDHWSVTQALPGDGQFRNAAGTTMLSVNERFNDIVNIAQDVYEKTQPATWGDSEIIDKDGQSHNQSLPGAWYSAKMRQGQPLADSFYREPPAEVSADMLQYGQELMGPIAQFLTGVYPALFGGPAKGAGGDTASGYQMQQASSMGRVGLVWRPLKRWWAKVMEQAIRVAAENREDDMSAGIPDARGKVERVTVRIEELKGEVYCYPETDENIPESYSQQRSSLMAVLPLADKNPVLMKFFTDPQNLRREQELLGLDGFVDPGADATDKAMENIATLLESGPAPNPQFAQLQAKLQQMTQHVAVGIHPDGQVEQLAMAMKSTPRVLPTIQPDPWDDNAAIAVTCSQWMTSRVGRQTRLKNPSGFANVTAYWQAQTQAMAAKMPPPMPAAPPPKPASAPHAAGG